MNPILKLLGVAEETEAHTAVTQLLGLKASVASLLTAYKVESIAELGSLIATSQKAVKDVTDKARAEKRTATIKALSTDGRLPPAQHAFAATLSDEQFETYVASLPESATPAPGVVTPLSTGAAPVAKTATKTVALTAEELELAKMFGQDTDEMLSVKTELTNSENPRMYTPRVSKKVA